MWIECGMRVDLIATCAARASRRSATKTVIDNGNDQQHQR